MKEVWKKNVLSVGLSSSFLEPLEATSIHSSIIQLVNFTQHKLSHIKENLLRESNVKSYNTEFNKMVDDFRDLIQIHYMVERKDTPFWKYIKNDLKRGDLVNKILELCEWRVPNSWDFGNYNGSAGWAVWSFILAGNKLISDKVLDNTMKTQGIHIMGPDTYQKLEEYWKKNSENYLDHTEFIDAIKNFNKNKLKNLELS